MPSMTTDIAESYVDYIDDVMRQGFTIEAPNAQQGGGCACGNGGGHGH